MSVTQSVGDVLRGGVLQVDRFDPSDLVVELGLPDGALVPIAIGFFTAQAAITRKAAQLGGLAGQPVGDQVAVGPGYKRAYQGCDIYFSGATGAHEVHGDIRAKYDLLGGAGGFLGFPTTDETTTPDGIGRFNHFQGGSIYWTPRTGPMMVRGAVRDAWAARGWELGDLGYPVVDEQRLTGLTPADPVNIAWSLFENGAIVATAGGADKAIAVDLSPAELRMVLRRRVDEEIHKSPDNVGLHPQVETLAVSEWSHGFWAARPRTVTFRLHGFRDNGLAPDTDFELDVRLRFALTWQAAFTAPTHKTLIAALEFIRVTAHGLSPGTVSQRVHDGVRRAFFRGGPHPDHPEVPDGAVFITTLATGAEQSGRGNLNVVDVLTTAQGGLQVLLNPLPPVAGGFRRIVAENAIRAIVEG